MTEQGKNGKFTKSEIKLGEPTIEQMEFAKKIYNELSDLKSKQYQKILKYKDLDINEVYSFFKDKYKLVKMLKGEGDLGVSTIVIRFNKSVGVIIGHYEVRLLRFYEQDKLISLSEMLECLNGVVCYSYITRSIGSTSKGWKNSVW